METMKGPGTRRHTPTASRNIDSIDIVPVPHKLFAAWLLYLRRKAAIFFKN
jgi:hypothetical protein